MLQISWRCKATNKDFHPKGCESERFPADALAFKSFRPAKHCVLTKSIAQYVPHCATFRTGHRPSRLLTADKLSKVKPPHHIPNTLLGVELDGEATWVTHGVRRPGLQPNRREARQHGGALADLAQEGGLAQVTHILKANEEGRSMLPIASSPSLYFVTLVHF